MTTENYQENWWRDSGHRISTYKPPTVQNWPKRASDATRNPLLSVVTCVCLWSERGWAYCTGGRSLSGSDSGGSGVTISFDGTFTVEPVPLAKPDVPLLLDDADVALVRVKFLTKLQMRIKCDIKHPDRSTHKSITRTFAACNRMFA